MSVPGWDTFESAAAVPGPSLGTNISTTRFTVRVLATCITNQITDNVVALLSELDAEQNKRDRSNGRQQRGRIRNEKKKVRGGRLHGRSPVFCCCYRYR